MKLLILGAGIMMMFFVALGRAHAATVQYLNRPAELSIDQISDITFRIRLAPLDAQGNPMPLRPSTVLVEQQPQNKLRTRAIDSASEISVGKLKLKISPSPLTLTVDNAAGKTVQSLVIGEDGIVKFQSSAPVLGLGEGAKQFDRRGAGYDMMRDGWDGWTMGVPRPVGRRAESAGGDRRTNGSWIAIPFVIGTDGWAIFVHQPEVQINLAETGSSFKVAEGKADGTLDFFVIAPASPADVLGEYDRLTGTPVMPPRWALGYMQSHRTLAGPDEVLGIARTFREKHLPIDALIYLGTGYCPAGWNTGHGSIEFNPATFDDPPKIIKTLHDENFHIVLHQNQPPNILEGESINAPGQALNRTNITGYWQHHLPAVKLGVDGWWADDGDPLNTEGRLARHRMYYLGSIDAVPNVRPWSLHRTGYAGIQRYGGWIWSGDIDSRWQTLATQVAVGQNHSLSLTPFWGTDIGGFFPTEELTGELYVRWFQFGTFCASMRAHGRTWHLRLPWGWNTGDYGIIESPGKPPESELLNPAVETICRKFLELRYGLLPYNYTLARQAHDSGLPMMRAMWLHYPDDPSAVTRADQYLWGRDLLVAPVTEKGATSRNVYLPAGTWYNWWTGDSLRGGREISQPAGLGSMPLFARAGAIIPLDPPREYTSEPVTAPTTIRVYTGADGEFTLYDDDGKSLAYLGDDPSATWIHITWNQQSRTLTVSPDPRMKQWPGGTRSFTIVPVGSNAINQRIDFRGEPVSVRL